MTTIVKVRAMIESQMRQAFEVTPGAPGVRVMILTGAAAGFPRSA